MNKNLRAEITELDNEDGLNSNTLHGCASTPLEDERLCFLKQNGYRRRSCSIRDTNTSAVLAWEKLSTSVWMFIKQQEQNLRHLSFSTIGKSNAQGVYDQTSFHDDDDIKDIIKRQHSEILMLKKRIKEFENCYGDPNSNKVHTYTEVPGGEESVAIDFDDNLQDVEIVRAYYKEQLSTISHLRETLEFFELINCM
mmetsp:Transcript_33318/g.38600  ORF Transcript_33318/g.38600 Transcript_33318/m.38600 type:complete len:196 (-) Transcript_33318:537-1124(-)